VFHDVVGEGVSTSRRAGDKVLLHDEKIRHGRSTKLTVPYIGPYEILDIDDVNITLKMPRNKTLKVHANRLKPYFG
jgi:hypothetical protein